MSDEKKPEGQVIPTIDVGSVGKSNTGTTQNIDATVQASALESDRAYRKITEDIIKETSEQLDEQNKAKKPLRLALLIFIISLLSVQFFALVAILFLNQRWGLEVTDFVINVYIVSLFVETLAGLLIMIRFAFNTDQENELIKILNSIIQNFKKYNEK